MCGCNKKVATATKVKVKPVQVKAKTTSAPRTYESGNKKFRVKVAR